MLIRQTSDGRWEIVADDGTVLTTVGTYDEGLTFIGGALTYAAAAGSLALPAADTGSEEGLLPDVWMSDRGICFSALTNAGDRDFTSCAWSWLDPASNLVPLMCQTETAPGHFAAQLAGFIREFHMLGTTPQASGRFYATDEGRAARDLLGGGRRFGVSVDGADADYEFTCTEEDEDGYCVDGLVTFSAYQIGGLTMTPFPAFSGDNPATIILSPQAVAASAAPPVTAAGAVQALVTVLDRPEILPVRARAAFEIAEPVLGEDFALGSLGDEWLIDQGDGHLAMPFHIDPDGSRGVVGHLAYWGQCHIGYENQCVSPPRSASAYSQFHVGTTGLDDGTTIATGALTAGCDHALTRLRAPEARDHYAHNGLAWADVRISDGVYGPWVCGVLRPDVTDEQIAVLRGGALSGDWRRLRFGDDGMELVGALAVTGPGFPIAREALIASGLPMIAEAGHVRFRTEAGEMQALVASSIVRRCPDCARRAAQQAATSPLRAPTGLVAPGVIDARLARIEALLGRLDRRTAPLVPAAARHIADQIR